MTTRTQPARLRAAVCTVFAWFVGFWPAGAPVPAAELLVGAATADITPDQSVPLTGFTTMRESTGVHSRCAVNVLAIESREGERVVDQAILVSCDLCVIRPGIQDGFRKVVADRLPGFDIEKLFLAATHTHAAPVLLQDRYESYGNAMQPKDYVPFMYERMAEAVVKAWERRAPSAAAWGLGHAVIGQNRRAVYEDGSGVMYGDTSKPNFRRIEGYEDHSVHVLCLYDAEKNPQAAVISLACPAQSVGGSRLSADFWHDARELLRERHGEQLVVLGFVSAAGDQAPNLLWNKAAEARMNRLRGLSQTQELGRRIANAFDDVLGVIEQDVRADVPFVHRVIRTDLPGRVVTDAEYAQAKAACDALDAKEKMVGSDWWNRHFWGYVVSRYETQQQGDPLYPVELHVMRLGDLAIATNPFELYLDYGVQIEARSPAPQTMLIQLAAPLDFAYYLPTPRAVAAGGYSAAVTHNLVGPEGGQALVDHTVEAIEQLWRKPAK
ncbi:MAG: hypothetical protein RBS80_13285 [Thermoguttaceae bacterium]|nr:hypothetical protein [Thermoguttaceae bacterium]